MLETQGQCSRHICEWKAGHLVERHVLVVVVVVVVAAAHVNQFDPWPLSFGHVVFDLTVGLVRLQLLPGFLDTRFSSKVYVRHDVSGNVRCKLSDRALFFVPFAWQSTKSQDCSYGVTQRRSSEAREEQHH